jgi:hypothetical protein
VEFVRESLGERVVEYRHGLAKRSVVLLEVGGGFVGVELEAQRGKFMRWLSAPF